MKLVKVSCYKPIFIFSSQVSHCLHELLDTCHNFSSLVSQTTTLGHERELEQLETLAKVRVSLVNQDFNDYPRLFNI